MSIRIAIAGNPNCGKTTLFNALTGSNQYVGNWPGVTVEKKEGKLKKHEGVIVTDLPGIYSLSPYTLEEVVARNYLIGERPDAILNIVDGTNLERNLYLTTQLTELGIPVVVAINMMDVVNKNGDKIDVCELSRAIGCKVVEISALKETGIDLAAEEAIEAAKNGNTVPRHIFSGEVEHAIAHIEEACIHDMPAEQQRWYAVKIFERDEKVLSELGISESIMSHIESDIEAVEKEFDDNSEAIIVNERYGYIEKILKNCYKKKNAGGLSTSDKIDMIVTNRILALPIFAIIMFLVYYISVTTVGTWLTDWANDGVFGDGWYLFGIGASEYEEALNEYVAGDIPDRSKFGVWVPGIPALLDSVLLNGEGEPIIAKWLYCLIMDGIVGGVGAVLGFVPQVLVLFLLLGFLEACGYMSRIAFVMDRIFRKFGLSGKSFIPILIGTGCGVPGIMASRTIENERDRRMTIITTTFIPCGAKLPIIALVSSALFGGAWWVAPSAYFMGIAAIIISGIILKKTKLFAGDPAPFVMELPAYHMPTVGSVLRSTWDRGWAFIKKAGTVILIANIIVWAGSVFGWTDSAFAFNPEIELVDSILGKIGGAICWLFAPLGFGMIEPAVATIMGLVAKEEVVGVFGVLEFEGLGQLAGYSFMAFNLLCAPCFAAMGAIRREMNNPKWTAFAITYQCTFAYAISLIVYNVGSLFTSDPTDTAGLIAAVVVALGILFMLLRSPAEEAASKK